MRLISTTPLWDPTSAVTKTTVANAAMAKIDAGTDLTRTFTVPSNGAVFYRLGGVVHGSTSQPQLLLGILQSATVIARMTPIGSRQSGSQLATTQVYSEIKGVVSGLTPGASLTWDAAVGVEDNVSSTGIKYGGPNDTTTNNAFGGFVFEIYEVPELLSNVVWDPGTAVTKVTTSLLGMTAFDTSLARNTFVCGPSGMATAFIRTMATKANSSQAIVLLGVLDGTTLKGRISPKASHSDTTGISNRQGLEAIFSVDGLTPGTTYNWDAAYGIEIVGVGGTPILGIGGPNDTTGDNAYGALNFAVLDPAPYNQVGISPIFF